MLTHMKKATSNQTLDFKRVKSSIPRQATSKEMARVTRVRDHNKKPAFVAEVYHQPLQFENWDEMWQLKMYQGGES